MAELTPAIKNPLFVSAAVCALVLYSGIVEKPVIHPFRTLLPENTVTELQGEIYGNPVKMHKSGLYKLTLQTEHTADRSGRQSGSTGRVTVFIPQNHIEVFYPGKLYTASNTSFNPSYSTESGNRVKVSGAFRNSVFYAHTVQPLPLSDSLRTRFIIFRSKCRIGFKRLMYAWGRAGGLLQALLCGSGEYLDDSLYISFRQTGLSYILALSGMHLSFCAGMILYLIKKIHSIKAVFLAQVCSVLLFIWFAGNSPSLFRAMLCRFIPLAAVFFCAVQLHPLTVLSLSFLIHTSVFPEQIYEAAYILSYCSLTGIYLLSPLFSARLSCILPGKTAKAVSDSSAAFLCTVPYSLLCFGTAAPGGIFASLFITPLITAFMYAGFAGILISALFPFLSVPSDSILNILYIIIEKTARFFSGFPVLGQKCISAKDIL